MSSESNLSQLTAIGGEQCPDCAASMAPDQLYCLECGARRLQPSSLLRSGPPAGRDAAQAAGPPPGLVTAPVLESPARGNTTAVIAGVGVLLLAMGVGILIGRSSSGSSQATAPAQPVISVASAGTTISGAGATPAATPFSDDWPAATDGYTVQLQTLPISGTQTSAVDAAKAAATAQGAKSVGALKSDDYSSLPSGNYLIYSGVYTSKAKAQAALGGLKRSFPTASVVKVSTAAASSAASSSGSSTGASSSGAGSSPSNPAPPSAVQNLRSGSGGSYEQKSKNLPNSISTG